MPNPTTLLPFQPATMTTAQLAAVSYPARYAGRTHTLYAYQLREWSTWCQTHGLDPLVGIQRDHIELYNRQLGERPLMDSTVNTMMHAVRGYFRFAHIDRLSASDPAVFAPRRSDPRATCRPPHHRARRPRSRQPRPPRRPLPHRLRRRRLTRLVPMSPPPSVGHHGQTHTQKSTWKLDDFRHTISQW